MNNLILAEISITGIATMVSCDSIIFCDIISKQKRLSGISCNVDDVAIHCLNRLI